MGLVVSAQVLRELIIDGEYLVDCIEQRERGKIVVAFTQRSRTQPYSIQLETMDHKLAGLFRALSGEVRLRTENRALMKVGSQAIPVVEVDSIPADMPKERGRRKRPSNGTAVSPAVETTKPEVRRRRAARQLILVPQEAPHAPAAKPTTSRRRAPRRGGSDHATP
jgi:hypothetical protein